MKHIIVPTDFSENALKAAKFAKTLASDLQADYSLIHAYQSFHSGFQSDSTNFQDEERTRNEAEKEMEIFIQKLKHKEGGESIKGKCVEGTLLSVINQIGNDKDKTILVMGTTGATGIKYHLIGSNTLYIAKKTNLPLLTIPVEISHCEIKKIAVFTDYKEEDKKNLSHIISIFGTSKVSYHLFHIHESNSKALPGDFEKLKNWADELRSICGLHDLVYELVEGDENVKIVNEISQREDIDLLTLTMLEQNFWDRFFEKSLAKAIVLQGVAPVFIQH